MWLQFHHNILSLNYFILQFVLISNLVAVQVQTKDENSNAVTGATAENGTKEWEAPLRVQKLFPYYITGFDKEDRPVITFQFGRWDFRTFLEEGGSNFEILDKYLEQMVQRFHDSPTTFAQSRGVNQYMVVMDMEGYELRQLSHPPSLRSALGLTRHFYRAVHQDSRFHKAIGVNANFLLQTLYSLAKPILGPVGGLIEMYGTNTEVWKPILLRQIPRSQLPEWCGGYANHTHVQTWG